MLFARYSFCCWALAALIALLGARGLRAEDDIRATLAARFQAVLDRPEFVPTHWGLLVVDVASGEVFYAHEADKLFAPASTTKLFTVAAALETLGGDYRWETSVYRRGEVDGDGVLNGDLVLVAGGDLTLGGRDRGDGQIAFTNVDHTYADGHAAATLVDCDPLAGLDRLAEQVAASGVKLIAGEAQVDDRLFDHDESTGSGPTRVTPIVVNDNLIDITIRPTAEGQPVEIDWRPHSRAYDVESDVVTGAAGSTTSVRLTLEEGRVLRVQGSIAAGRGPLMRSYAVRDPTAFARALWIEALERAGVRCANIDPPTRTATRLPEHVRDYDPATRVAHLPSPTLAEEAKLILKVSHNLHASTLPVLLAVHHGRRTLADGMRFEAEALARLGVDVETISFGGGAGGSRADAVTPRATVSLLRAMQGRSDFAVFRDALPVLGIDGTLADAVAADSPARGKVRAKTGTFYWQNGLRDRPLLISKALAGYADTRQGRTLAFAFFMNHVHLQHVDQRSAMGRVLGELCEMMVDAL